MRCKHTRILTQLFSPQVVSVQSVFPEERQRCATTAAGITARAAIRTTPSSSQHACCTTGTPASTRWERTHRLYKTYSLYLLRKYAVSYSEQLEHQQGNWVFKRIVCMCVFHVAFKLYPFNKFITFYFLQVKLEWGLQETSFYLAQILPVKYMQVHIHGHIFAFYLLVIVESVQRCKILSLSIINCYAVFWCLINLETRRFITQTGLPGSYLISHRYLKQHAHKNTAPCIVIM